MWDSQTFEDAERKHSMQIDAVTHTDIGRTREQNEDCQLIDRGIGLFIICDGMGGHAAGEVASTQAARMTAEKIREHVDEINRVTAKPGGHFKVVKIVADAVRVACRHLYAMACSESECAGMGTTLTLLMIRNDKAILAHAGDSRLYLVRDKELHMLSNDHTLAEEFARQSSEPIDPAVYRKFSNVLTRSLGPQESVDVETLLFDILPADRFLICSDGLSNYFTEEAELVRLLLDDDFDSIPRRLTEIANSRGGNDNITSIVLRARADDSTPSSDTGRYIELLKTTFLFENLPLKRLMRLVNISAVQSYSKDEWIIQEGDERSGLFIVVDGQCRLAQADGNMIVVSEGHCFGETALACGGNFLIQVRSITDVKLLHIPREAFHTLTRRYPRLGRRLLNKLIDHLSRRLDSGDAAAAALRSTMEW